MGHQLCLLRTFRTQKVRPRVRVLTRRAKHLRLFVAGGDALLSSIRKLRKCSRMQIIWVNEKSRVVI
jgi:hypothetical protein